MQKKCLLLSVLIAATTLAVDAQTMLFDSPGNPYVDGISQSSHDEFFGIRPEEDRFWQTRRVSATYGYSAVLNKNDHDVREDIHSAQVGLYLESASGLILNIDALYVRNSFDLPSGYFGVEYETDRYGISIQPAYDLLKLWNSSDRPGFLERSRLIAGAGFDYVYGEGKFKQQLFGGPFFPTSFRNESEGFAISPRLVWVQPASENFIVFLSPAYSFGWYETRVRGFSSNSDEIAGPFTLTARADYGVCERFSASVFSTWIRETDNRTRDDDYAEFGGQLRVALSERIGFRIGYSYLAFHEFLEAHSGLVRVEAGF